MNRVPLPSDVRQWINSLFKSCNARVANKLAMIPNIHEFGLDLTLIERFSHAAAPIRLPSKWVVRIETHYLGGYRLFMSWEVADIGRGKGGRSSLSQVSD